MKLSKAYNIALFIIALITISSGLLNGINYLHNKRKEIISTRDSILIKNITSHIDEKFRTYESKYTIATKNIVQDEIRPIKNDIESIKNKVNANHTVILKHLRDVNDIDKIIEYMKSYEMEKIKELETYKPIE